MTYKLNPFTGKLDTSDGPQGPAGVVSAAGPGSQGSPSISFAADLDTGLYNYTPNGIAVSTAGTGRLFIDANGNVGVGTTSPSFPLHVSSTGTVAQIESTNSASAELRLKTSIRDWTTYVDTTGDYVLRDRTGSTEALRVDTSRRLLVGTSSSVGDDNNLQVVGSTADASSATFWRSSSDVGNPSINFVKTRGSVASPSIVSSGDTLGHIRFNGHDGASHNSRAVEIKAVVDGTPGVNDMPGRLVFSTTADGNSAPNPRMTIKSDGNVGIGTTSPGTNLQVQGSGTCDIRIRSAGASAPTSLQFWARNSADNAVRQSHIIGTESGLSFATATTNNTTPTERLRIDSSGNVGIGSTSPMFSNGSGVEIERSGISTLRIEDSSGLGAVVEIFADDGEMSAIYDSRGNPSNHGHQFRVNGSEKLRIDSSGRVGIGETNPVSKLVIKNTSSNDGIRVISSTTGEGFVLFGDTADSNTGGIVYSHTNDALEFNVNNSERMRIDSSGRLLVGTSTADNDYYISSVAYTPGIQFKGSGYNPSLALNRTDGGAFVFVANSQNVTTGGRAFGGMSFNGFDGANLLAGARIAAEADGTTGANDMPGRLVFSTTADGASTPTERMRITSTGQMRLAGAGITFNGDTATANELDDYEEGTWTPGNVSVGAGDALSAVYTKVGDLVTVNVRSRGVITFTDGNPRIDGLPFSQTINAGAGSWFVANGNWTSHYSSGQCAAVDNYAVTYSDSILLDSLPSMLSGYRFQLTVKYFT